MLETQIEASLDAILVVDATPRIISYNHNFISMWQITSNLMGITDDALMLQSFVEQAADPVAFASGIEYLYEHRDVKSREQIHLKDGRLIDRYSAPIADTDGKYYGRVWFFRDITEREAALARIKYLNRVFAVQSGINSLIVRVQDRDELFREACNRPP